jgi:hypothetical protein
VRTLSLSHVMLFGPSEPGGSCRNSRRVMPSARDSKSCSTQRARVAGEIARSIAPPMSRSTESGQNCGALRR